MHGSVTGADPAPAGRTITVRRSTRTFLALVIGLAVAVPVQFVTGRPTPIAHAERVWTVAPWGDDAAAGTADAPLASVQTAVDRAVTGDTIELRGGIYRESVRVTDERLVIRSVDGERAVFDGAIVVDGFRPSDGRWFASGWTTQFFREASGGPVAADRIVAGYPDQVFIDGRPMRQVLSAAEVGPGTFFHETDTDRLWIGDDPLGRTVEASRLGYGFHFERAHGSELHDVTIRRFATERRDMAAIRAYADRLTLTGLDVELNARMGLSAIGERIVVSESRFVDNGYLGVHAHRVDTLVLDEVLVRGNNREGFDAFHSGAGIKVTASRGVTVRESDVSDNAGPGIWTDLDTRSVTIVRNLIEGNQRAGVEIELSSDVNVLSNVAVDNGEAGIWVLESQNVQVLHNASFGNVNAIEVEEGPRREVRNVRIANNTMGAPAPGSRALLDVNDWTAERSAAQMGVVADHNAYWLPPESTTPLSRWAVWPDPLAFSGELDGHRARTGQDTNSLLRRDESNPLVRDAARFDLRGRDELQRGAPVTGQAARDLGIDGGDPRRIGPVAPVVRR